MNTNTNIEITNTTMKTNKFKNIKVGDIVELKNNRSIYFTCSRNLSSDLYSPDGRAYVPAGNKGIVKTINIPAVSGRERNFIKIEFNLNDITLVDCAGRPLPEIKNWLNIKNKTVSVAAFPEDLK